MLLNFFCIFAYAKMLYNGAMPQTPLPSRNQSINTGDVLHTQHEIMGFHPKPHIFYEITERKTMEKIKQLQKIAILTPYHLGKLIATVEQVEQELHRNKQYQNMLNRQDIATYLEQIKLQANIIRKARNTYGTNDLVAVMRLEIAQNQLQKLLK